METPQVIANNKRPFGSVIKNRYLAPYDIVAFY